MNPYLADYVRVELPAPEDEEDHMLLKAMTDLGRFIIEQAEEAAAQVGFHWVARAAAPENYMELQGAFRHSRETGEPLPVSSAHSDSVIYVTPRVNFAMRFWHDVRHVQTGLTFDLVDELELAQIQLQEAEAAGIRRHDQAWRLLHADLAG